MANVFNDSFLFESMRPLGTLAICITSFYKIIHTIINLLNYLIIITAIPRMLALNNELISNPSSHSTHDQFVATLKELLESIQDIQDVLSSGIDIPKQEESSFEGSSTSASRLTAQERMMRKKLRSLNTRSRYIGSLGAAVKGDTSRTRTTFDETDSQLEVIFRLLTPGT